jgi:hypothetical protein
VGELRVVSLGDLKGLVVLEASARHDVDQYYTVVDADHFQITRPESRMSGRF